MSEEAMIVLKMAKNIPLFDGDYIGADKGAFLCAQKGIVMEMAIGDFDSVNSEELKVIQNSCRKFIKLNPVKDDSDSESAVNHAFSAGYKKVYLTGALGGRMDHAYVNVQLVKKNPGRVILMDEQNRLEAFAAGEYLFDSSYPYISFFSENALISLEGFRYPLERRRIITEDIYTLSNEVMGEKGKLTVHEGVVLVIQCKDK